jgi:hypothetical protein
MRLWSSSVHLVEAVRRTDEHRECDADVGQRSNNGCDAVEATDPPWGRDDAPEIRSLCMNVPGALTADRFTSDQSVQTQEGGLLGMRLARPDGA